MTSRVPTQPRNTRPGAPATMPRGARAQFQAEGHELQDEDIARLSPLEHRNLNLLGRYSFTASTPAAGNLRPLRDPGMPKLARTTTGAGRSECLTMSDGAPRALLARAIGKASGQFS
nr:Tn3 family transposase [Streptomyces sp. PanSC19]